MRILSVRRWATLDADQQTRLLARSTAAIFEPGLVASIERLFADVRARGDAAVVEATQQFDGVAITPGDLRVRPEELAAAHAEISPELMVGIREAIANSRLFNEAQVRATAAGWRQEVRPGFLVGEQVAPIPSVGLYVPAGKGSFPSVLCQIGTPAVVAGVPEIMVLIPPMPGTGRVDPATLATAHELGLANIFRANGPAGIAALTFGTAMFPRVRKIVGPGSPAVTAAQVLAQRFGTASNMLCGPSESLLIADATADPWRLALDLVNEAEHGTDSAALVVTDSTTLAAALEPAVVAAIALLPEPRRTYATAVLGDLGGVLLFDTMDEAVAFANDYAPEHCQVATADTEATLRALRYAGEALLGQNTPIGASSYTIGIPATLPTGGYAQLNGGVTARTFQTTTSIARLSEAALAGLASPTTALADHEGFPAHANAFRGRGLG
ncbi:MAG TPA: histidinol dehydrogenase [Verrucomicrobiae bacterium]|nr:histidinol dehydrogenase [Verrucomicrobiae bacterium]